MISIILLEPENPGNIGAVARVMANFGFKSLVIINPACDPGDIEAIKRSKFGKHVLEGAKIAKKSELKKFDYLVGTTAKLGSDYNIPRSPVSPKELAGILAGHNSKKSKIGLLLGREGIGLTNEEIGMCDFIATIPASKDYGTLNISHAASIILYELFIALKKQNISSHIVFAGKKEKDQIMKMFDDVLDSLEFSTPTKRQTQVTVWKKLIGKSFLTRREAFALMGLLKKLKK